MNTEQKIEALLFYQNEPMEIKKISKILDISENETRDGLNKLSDSLKHRGICLIVSDTEASLATASTMKDMIEKIAKDEMSKEIGKAGLETLAIILYNGPVSRREVDYIRGVNSTFILRNLAIRGLIERESGGERGFKYKPTASLFAHLGITKAADLPEYQEFVKKVESISEDKNGSE